jgi:hypothetical protein
MDTRKQSLTWLIPLTLIFTLAARCDNSLDVVQQAQIQSKAGVQVVVAQSPAPAFQGVAGGELALFKHQENNLKASVLAHPVPEVWLVFAVPAESEKPQGIGNASVATVKVELPQEAEQTIQSQWELVLARQYEREVVGLRDVKSGISNDVAVANSFLNTGRELQKLLINAPDGKRNISQDEAYSIASFINASAVDVIKQVKKYKD